jgi:hypothetical protein
MEPEYTKILTWIVIVIGVLIAASIAIGMLKLLISLVIHILPWVVIIGIVIIALEHFKIIHF